MPAISCSFGFSGPQGTGAPAGPDPEGTIQRGLRSRLLLTPVLRPHPARSWTGRPPSLGSPGGPAAVRARDTKASSIHRRWITSDVAVSDMGDRYDSRGPWLARLPTKASLVAGAIIAVSGVASMSLAASAHAAPLQQSSGTANLVPVTLASSTAPRADSPAPLLSVTTHSPSVPRYQQFSYQTGTIPGLASNVREQVTTQIQDMVQRAVTAARTTSRTTCPVGSDPCGIFRQKLRTYTCSTGLLCITQEVGLLRPGMNSSQQWVDTLVLDAHTGEARPLKEFVPRAAMPAFLAATTGSVRSHLATDGIASDPFWNDPIKRSQLRAWIPTRAGLRVWFDKYSAGPGSMGVVQVLVPWVPGSGPAPR